ncbi:MAG: hypothetical protein LBB88_09010 [Planctomycetaceae bacterium]|jgi:hypothetical protein|nr:hypothetical protein [Planctomycetaceae bacterium]
MSTYEKINFKIPEESYDYRECSDYVIKEIVGYKAYDLKYLSSNDISYNPALGTGQIQIKDIHYVTISYRNVWEFCQLIDEKYMASSKRTFNDWIKLAKQNKWIKFDE